VTWSVLVAVAFLTSAGRMEGSPAAGCLAASWRPQLRCFTRKEVDGGVEAKGYRMSKRSGRGREVYNVISWQLDASRNQRP
jgi:hypothetical protein